MKGLGSHEFGSLQFWLGSNLFTQRYTPNDLTEIDLHGEGSEGLSLHGEDNDLVFTPNEPSFYHPSMQ